MKFIVVMLLLCWGSPAAIMAQRVCGTVMPMGEAVSINGFSTNGVGSGSSHARDTVRDEVINIPVVVHVVYNTAAQNISDEQIISQIKVLNEDYRLRNANAVNIPSVFKSRAADVRINFCLAKVDATGHLTSGIIRKHTSNGYFLDDAIKFSAQGGDNAWDSKKYLNIWVCYLFGRSLGYSSIPGGPADKDGVVINFDVFGRTGTLRTEFNMGRTATHEIGHWLGLKHLWGDEDCGNDGIDDTPRQRFPNYYCTSFPHATSCSPDANGDMFMNYMDFSDDACMNMFTQGQKMEMRSQFAINGSRNSFLNSFACDSAMATAGPLPTDTLVTTPVVTKPVVAAAINVYPNPANDILNITGTDALSLTGKTAIIISTTGKIVLQQKLQSNAVKINVAHLIAGIYILQVGEGSDRKTFKVIKL